MAFSIGNTARAYLSSFPGDPDIKTLREAGLDKTSGMELVGSIPAMNQLVGSKMAMTQMGIDGTLAQQEMINAVKMAQIEQNAKNNKNASLLSLLGGIGGNRKAGSSLADALNFDMALGSPITKANIEDANYAADPLGAVKVFTQTPEALFPNVEIPVTKQLEKVKVKSIDDLANDPTSEVGKVVQKWSNKYKNFKQGLQNQ